ncbi:acyltransferase family protein [Olivibacter sitiensis]|uniref:acyltransferase family protein n=1 Tax=Olivibacter sitiensis TaxID=376470 RepID=UPI000402A48D|nr:acyltransferase [Olivibacter sitiensis]
MILLGQPKLINPITSFMLDSLRIIAALTVLFSHAMDQWFPDTQHTIEDNGTFAHAAVVVFFVLSGYVICYTTTNNNRGVKQYAVARLSKLTSVVYPALVVSIIVQLILKEFNPDLFKNYHRGHDIIRYPLTALFSNEIWLLSAAPPINRPLWSLSFEFWYYLIFGFWFYKGKGILGWLVLILVCLLAGPKILAMMPIWVFGCLAYRLPKPNLKFSFNWFLFVLLLVIAILLMLYLKPIPKGIGASPFYFANQFITDWIVGLIIAIAIWLIPNKEFNSVQISKSFISNFRKIADLTFPIYVLHLPLLLLFRTIVPFEKYNMIQYIFGVTVVLGVACILGLLIEKQRIVWVNLWKSIFGMKVQKRVKFNG